MNDDALAKIRLDRDCRMANYTEQKETTMKTKTIPEIEKDIATLMTEVKSIGDALRSYMDNLAQLREQLDIKRDENNSVLPTQDENCRNFR